MEKEPNNKKVLAGLNMYFNRSVAEKFAELEQNEKNYKVAEIVDDVIMSEIKDMKNPIFSAELGGGAHPDRYDKLFAQLLNEPQGHIDWVDVSPFMLELAKKYIDLRISEQVLPIRENDIYKGNKIKDPIIRAEFNLLEDEVRTLKLENQGLKKLFENIEIGLEGGQVSFQREDKIDYKDLINKLVRFLESQGCEEYRGRFCLNKDIVLSKEEWNIIRSKIY